MSNENIKSFIFQNYKQKKNLKSEKQKILKWDENNNVLFTQIMSKIEINVI